MLEPSSPLPLPVEEPAAPPRPRAVRLLAALGPDFTLFFCFLALFVTLGMIYGASFHIWEGSIFIAAGAAGGLIGARFLFRARSIVADEPGARGGFRAAARE